MALSEKDRNFIGVIALALAVAGLFIFAPPTWLPFFSHQQSAVKITELRVKIDSLNVQIDSARRDLARGSVEALRQRVKDYQDAVVLMRRLVPSAGEVPNLIDDISSRARRRGVGLAQFTPIAEEAGSPFQTNRYRFSVIGRFDPIGEFLSDVGSLPRIMVPYGVTLVPANQQAQQVYGDTTGALLEVGFQLRTYVKRPGAADTTGAGDSQ
ncbi:MAG: type 4a pilus biogenesis protein PilO [Gemmatimonadetes bacterium]|nr:type 4a pilus biogenesis protein PilO [Gemmatimonadota bacterium]